MGYCGLLHFLRIDVTKPSGAHYRNIHEGQCSRLFITRWWCFDLFTLQEDGVYLIDSSYIFSSISFLLIFSLSFFPYHLHLSFLFLLFLHISWFRWILNVREVLSFYSWELLQSETPRKYNMVSGFCLLATIPLNGNYFPHLICFLGFISEPYGTIASTIYIN